MAKLILKDKESAEHAMNSEATRCHDMASVRFAIYPDGFDGPRVMARISEEALKEVFHASGEEASLIGACQANFGLIEAKALARHRAAPSRAVVLSTADFSVSTYCHQ
jgi:hypothetical protein